MSEQSPEDRLDVMTGWLQQAIMSGGEGDFETWRVGPGLVGIATIARGDEQEREFLVRLSEINPASALERAEAEGDDV